MFKNTVKAGDIVMNAVIFKGKHEMEYKEVDHQTPGPNEMLLQVKACGICGTDQHIYHGQPGSAKVVPPRVLGHEFAGEVVMVGGDVKGFQVGDRVSVDPNIYCGSCEYCQNGTPHLCDNLEALGVTIDGGMAEYCLVPAANCYHLPEGLTFQEGALIEPLGCVIHGIKQLNITPGASVFIIGGGFIGQLMLQMVKMYGCSPVRVCEPDTAKHSTLLKLGATEVVTPTNADSYQADIVIECVGRQQTMEQAIRLTKKGGQVLLFGVASPMTEILVSPFEIFSKELTIHGSFINPHTHRQAISLVSQGMIDLKSLISHTFSLRELPDIFSTYHQLSVTKGMIEVSK